MLTDEQIPTRLMAGTSWFWCNLETYQKYKPPEWHIEYVLRPLTGGNAHIVHSVEGVECYHFYVSIDDSASIAPGTYEWTVLAYGPDDTRVWIDSGRVAVLPDPTTAEGDLRSSAERILDAINATLEGRVSKDADSYTIEGRSITRTPMADLLRLQGIYERKVAAERNPGGSFLSYRRVKL